MKRVLALLTLFTIVFAAMAALLLTGGKSGYKVDAVIPQHTFKLDVALLRKFLL